MAFKTLLFIPMYNCEKQIVRVLGQLSNDVCKYISEVIVVNNRSTDSGETVVIDYLKNNRIPIKVTLIRNDENYGLGGSHKVAFNYAIQNGVDYVIVLHGDDQGRINDLIPYLKDGEAYKYDSFLGSRFTNGSELVNYSRFRVFGNHVFNLFLSIMLGRNIRDLGAGLNIYKVEYLKTKFYMPFIDNLTFNVYMLIYGVYSKSCFTFFPLTWRETDQVSNAKFMRQSMEILGITCGYVVKKGKVFAPDSSNSCKEYSSKVIYSNQ